MADGGGSKEDQWVLAQAMSCQTAPLRYAAQQDACKGGLPPVDP